MPTCNKCGREGLSWGKKTLKDGKVINILLEVDGSEHRPYKDGEAKCNPVALAQKVDSNQERLPTPKPEPKVTTDITDPKTTDKARNIFKVFRINAIQLAVSENIGNLFSDNNEAPFTAIQEDEIKWVFDRLLEISRSRLM